MLRSLPPLLLALCQLPATTHTQHAQHLPYFGSNLIVMELENFTTAADAAGWSARPWLTSANRFAASVADTYLSRRAYLHGPANVTASATATMSFELSADEAGCYDVLLRYESAFNFETPVRLSIAKSGTAAPVFERIYGQRHSLKVFPFGAARLGPTGNGTGASMCGPGRPPTDLMQAECWWPYGSTEQCVWEGVGANVTLEGPGSYTVTVTGETETGVSTPPADGIPAEFAERSLDVLVLSRNHSDIRMRLEHAPLVLPLDGLLTQGGEVFMKVHNHNATQPLNFTVPFVMGHSIYWDTHLRLPLAAATPGATPTSSCTHTGGPQCPVISVAAGAVSDWVDVGGLMDAFNHGQWNFQFGNYSLEIGVLGDANAAAGGLRSQGGPDIETIGTFDSQGSSLKLLFDANTRGSRRIRARTEDVFAVAALLDEQSKTMVTGRLPTEVPFFGTFFQPEPMTGSIPVPGQPPHKQEPAVCPRCGEEYATMFERIHAMFSGPGPAGVQPTDWIDRNASGLPPADDTKPFKFGYIDVRQFIGPYDPVGLAAAVGASNATFDPPYLWPRTDEERASIRVVSLGDEITIASPVPTDTDNASFAVWAKAKGLVPADVGCDKWGGSCLPDAVTVPEVDASAGQRGMYYYASRFLNDMGVSHFKKVVAIIQKFLPNAAIGANYSPTEFKTDTRDGQQRCNAYLGNAFQWLRTFKEGGSTLPWSEDWQWQTPIGSQQMETLVIDVQRAAMTKWPASTPLGGNVRARPLAKPGFGAEGRPPQMMYLLPEFPGEHPINWRRNMYGMIGHGVKYFDLFIFATAQEGQHTCDYTDPDDGTYQGVRRGLNEMGMMDDIVAAGVAQPYAAAALLFAETADIWWGSISMGAAKRSLYIALRHAQLSVDVVSEEDCEAGALNHYSTLYIVEPQVSESAMGAIATWVNAGGSLVLTAAAATLNETNSSNVASTELLAPAGVVRSSATWTGTRFSRENATIYYVKEQLPWAEKLDSVTPTAQGVAGDALSVFGDKAMTDLSNSSSAVTVLATFGDGSPAELRVASTAGNITIFNYHPGLSYFHPATPRRPVDRSPHPDAFCNFVPTDFGAAIRARKALAEPVDSAGGSSAEARPVVSDEPLVEASLVLSAKGALITLVNWSENIKTVDAEPTKTVTVTLGTPLPQFKTASLASCGVRSVSECSPSLHYDAAAGVVSAKLAIADAVILR
jgi:hypothetical protein